VERAGSREPVGTRQNGECVLEGDDACKECAGRTSRVRGVK